MDSGFLLLCTILLDHTFRPARYCTRLELNKLTGCDHSRAVVLLDTPILAGVPLSGVGSDNKDCDFLL
jgi:hypothetical protein